MQSCCGSVIIIEMDDDGHRVLITDPIDHMLENILSHKNRFKTPEAAPPWIQPLGVWSDESD